MIMVYHNIVMFPKLTFEAMKYYPHLIIDDKRIAGRRLVDMLAKVTVAEEDERLPDISIYDVDTKEWRDLYVPIEETRKLRTKKETFTYYPLLIQSGSLRLVLSYLQSYSDVNLAYLSESKSFPNFKEDLIRSHVM